MDPGPISTKNRGTKKERRKFSAVCLRRSFVEKRGGTEIEGIVIARRVPGGGKKRTYSKDLIDETP